MLLKKPAEFEHKAREWAEKYAGAPKRDEGQGSGGATAETIRKAREQAREKTAQARAEQCVQPLLKSNANGAGTAATIKTW
jgi:ubiquitin-conjugating enzyme (huntingtin interacting protein 2)